jgi:hypothetical protein
MEDALDQANAIWSRILNADQMKALGLSKEGGRQAKRHKPENKDHSRKGNKPANNHLTTTWWQWWPAWH